MGIRPFPQKASVVMPPLLGRRLTKTIPAEFTQPDNLLPTCNGLGFAF
jgi:hypothetical protein